MNPSQISGLAMFPNVERLFVDHVDMQFNDVRVLLRLPITEGARPWPLLFLDRLFNRDLTAGCNFAAASLLMNLLSGFSVILYDDPGPRMPAATVPSMRGPRLRHLLDTFFPHDSSLLKYRLGRLGTRYCRTRDSAVKSEIDKLNGELAKLPPGVALCIAG